MAPQGPKSSLTSKNKVSDETDGNLSHWRRQISSRTRQTLSEEDVRSILLRATELMSSGSADIVHEVIKSFAAEGGLHVIKATVERDFIRVGEVAIHLFRVLSHPDAVSSLVLEQHLGTIHNFLYGVGGMRGGSFFNRVIDHLHNLKDGGNAEAYEQMLALSLNVFTSTVAINQSAAISEDMRNLARRFEQCGADLFRNPQPRSTAALQASKSLQEVQLRLQISKNMPDAVDVSKIAERLAEFRIQQDLPGDLCQTGRRHDNDFAEITDVQILPTAMEISSSLPEYLPRRDPRQHHLPGVRGLLDRQFRLLREDTVGQLRDAVRAYSLRDAQDSRHTNRTSSVYSHGMRMNVFKNAIITGSFVDKGLGFLQLVEFDQPDGMRKLSKKARLRAWQESRDLALDSCVCMLDANREVVFCCVAERRPATTGSEESTWYQPLNKSVLGDRLSTLDHDPRRAAIVLRIINLDRDVTATILRRQNVRGQTGTLHTLLEFPGVLLASFNHTLEALQFMSRAGTLPFADVIAPQSLSSATPVTSQPPQYAMRAAFEFDLSQTSRGADIRFSPLRDQAFDLTAFSKASGLDRSQAHAFVHALSSRFALIQGPPGTGKSFVGVQLIRTLLQNRKAAGIGPILCVCYTNHALDQILENCVHHGIKQIVRVGGRSKSTALADVNLAKLSKAIDRTRNEKKILWETHSDLDDIVDDASSQIAVVVNASSEKAVMRHLQAKHPTFYNTLFGDKDSKDGFRRVIHEPAKTFATWLRGGPRDVGASTGVNVPAETLVSGKPPATRRSLFNQWVREIRESAIEELQDLCEKFLSQKRTLDRCHRETSLRCLQQAQIIGITTTGLAKNIEVLRKLNLKVLIVEEAAEVMEAHMLPAFLPSLEHVIAIGDHQQLRPQIANFELSVESNRGAQYSLDVSLFERLIHPEPGLPSLPHATLQTQRRMHPSISRLIRSTIYPELADGESVMSYPDIPGLRHRLFWLDHQALEDSDEQMSKSNAFEVEMTAALTLYIIRQGVYKHSQITILTPYLAQLRNLRRRFANTFEIVVGDRDQADLAAAGMADETDAGGAERASLGSSLRISTVDNYQGEENDIIFVSLVRSNEANKVGFLRTQNRINVLLSRARHGMYIIGNATIAQTVPMWQQVTDILKSDGLIGLKLPLYCRQHPDTHTEVSCPDDFARLAPEGGCILMCGKRLKCGHSCINKCHAEYLHDVVVCQSPCPRLKGTCSHLCTKICGLPCDKKCQAKVENTPLPCGHIALKLRCFESQAPNSVECQHKVLKTVPHCGHVVEVHCFQDVTHDFRCKTPCMASLPCGHSCARSCSDCNITDEDGQTHTGHGTCEKKCNRNRNACSHQCQERCHGDRPCKPCDEKCQVQCAHSRCSKRCSEPCAPCAERCNWECEHRGACMLPCSVPCSRLPCTERCAKMLSCGHQCPSICGEICPDRRFCQQCGDLDVLEREVDYITFEAFKDLDLASDPVIVPPCGHLQTVSSFDGIMDMKSFYELDESSRVQALKCSSVPFEMSAIKTCPTCRAPLRSINRYSRIVKRGLIDESTKRFVVWANATFVNLEEQGHQLEVQLQNSVDTAEFDGRLRSHRDSVVEADQLAVELSGSPTRILRTIESLSETYDRYKAISKYRKGLARFCSEVAVEEQPFQRVWDMCRSASTIATNRDESAAEIAGLEAFESGADSALNVRNHLMTRSLLLHTDMGVLSDFVEIWLRSRRTMPTIRPLQVDTTAARVGCLALLKEATNRQQPREQVQALLYFGLFAAAELRCMSDSSAAATELRRSAVERLDEAERIIQTTPSTAMLSAQVKSVRVALTGVFMSMVTDEEMRAVYAAMATEFRGTGHWYRCENGHPFTIGECGMPMQLATCPQCGAAVGGQNHRSVGGVRRADDIEREFGRAT